MNNLKPDFVKNTIVLVPAAGSVNSSCNYKLAFKDPSLLNIGTCLAIEEIEKNTNLKVVLAVNNKNNKIYNLKPFNNLNIIEVGDTKSITDTIKKSLQNINSKWCLINPITSIPKKTVYSEPFIEFCSKKLPKENWSSISLNEKGYPKFHCKNEAESKGKLSYPFTGRILSKTKDLISIINDLEEFEKNDLINLAKKLFFKKSTDIKFNEWLDIGHIATYPITRATSIKSRFFNDLSYNENKKIIKKKSLKKSKIRQEISYYKTIPTEIKRYFPMIFNVEEDKSFLSYEMDYICKPTLAEIYLFGEIGPNAISRIINSIAQIYNTFYLGDPLLKENTSWLYTTKTQSRQNEIEKLLNKKEYEIIKNIYYEDFQVNDINLPSLKKSFSFIKEELSKFELNRPLHIGHGDLCFNNILVEPIYGQINLIDPKADKHKTLNISGLIDNNYDLSKLNHSINGFYDSIVNNLYSLKSITKNKFYFEIYKPKEHEIYSYYFKENILKDRITKKAIKVLTANLFLTMLPFHLEDTNRMISFSLIASILISNKKISKIA